VITPLPGILEAPNGCAKIKFYAKDMQDVVYAVALSEAVYKLVDIGPEGAVDHANSILAKIPPGVTTSLKFQCSVENVSHRYVFHHSVAMSWHACFQKTHDAISSDGMSTASNWHQS
jgi:hypothetical protein